MKDWVRLRSHHTVSHGHSGGGAGGRVLQEAEESNFSGMLGPFMECSAKLRMPTDFSRPSRSSCGGICPTRARRVARAWSSVVDGGVGVVGIALGLGSNGPSTCYICR